MLKSLLFLSFLTLSVICPLTCQEMSHSKDSAKKTDAKQEKQTKKDSKEEKKSNHENEKKEPERRAKPAPFDSIFPITEYLGPTIGVPDTEMSSPLTKVLWKHSPCLKKEMFKVYGWIEPSVNLSTSHHTNLPMGYDIVPNSVQLDQLVLRFERTPDTVQMDHIDWGFTFTSLFGIDYRFSIAQGYFSNQLIAHNYLYGYDPVEIFGQIYFPCVAEGMVVTIGRYISPADIEVPLAPYNFLFTHSLALTYVGATQTGINAAIKFNDQWTVQIGAHAGNDVAPWAQGRHIPSLLALVRWVSCDNNDSLWGGVDSWNGGNFTGHHDNLQEFNLTWTHRFNKNFFTMTEAYYMYQTNGRLGGTCIFGPSRPFAAGGGCGPLIPGYSWEMGVVNYTELKVTPKDFISFRTDYLNDHDGERTGFRTKYMSFTLGLTHQFCELVEIRPEIRYEFAFNEKPYDNGRKKQQASFNMDLIAKF